MLPSSLLCSLLFVVTGPAEIRSPRSAPSMQVTTELCFLDVTAERLSLFGFKTERGQPSPPPVVLVREAFSAALRRAKELDCANIYSRPMTSGASGLPREVQITLDQDTW